VTALARALIDELASDPEALERLRDLIGNLPTDPPATDGWLDTKRAAEHLGVSVHALHRLVADRRVPYHQERPGARCWFRRAELDAWRGEATPEQGVVTHPAGRRPRLS